MFNRKFSVIAIIVVIIGSGISGLYIMYQKNYFYDININGLAYVQSNKTRNPDTNKVPEFTESELKYFDELDSIFKNSIIYCTEKLKCNINETKFEVDEDNYSFYYPDDFIFNIDNNESLTVDEGNFKTIISYQISSDNKNINDTHMGIAVNNEKYYLVWVNSVSSPKYHDVMYIIDINL